ncbi:ABC transporter permease [Mesorhizobium sp. BAC0120]|uniref:ABC transporter permease n=1 Tax=Mesorhizobium sp. BAC0120 TaxID=3090670 RepID=UPI00298CCEB1|nr:ABC transporter permease [Mesorhizobium sp. BAC0120]MDW6024736.1 ABC transporter permease [Mesorhizobium sp. BAC0120]
MTMRFRYSLPFYIVAWSALLFLMAPIFVVVPVSLTPTSFLSFPTEGLSLRHYQQLFQDPAWYRSMGQSVIIGLCSTVLATAVGTAAAIGALRLGGTLAMTTRVLALLPLIVPPVVSALALYRSWVLLGLFDSWAGTILAHAILGVPYVFITVSAALSRLDPSIAMAARNLGAGWARTQLQIVLPNIRSGVFAGAVFAFITSWDELVVTLFITSRGIFTLPRRMWDGIRENISPTIAAVATILILFSILLLLAMRLIRGRDA